MVNILYHAVLSLSSVNKNFEKEGQKMTNREKSAYLDLSKEFRDEAVETLEQELDIAMNKIESDDIRNEIDLLVGRLIVAHEYKGFKIGREEELLQ